MQARRTVARDRVRELTRVRSDRELAYESRMEDLNVSRADEARAMELAAKDFEKLSTADKSLVLRVQAKQELEVRKQYEGTAMWLMEANGKPSNLDERQWLHVRTPLFKRMFGDWEALELRKFLESGNLVSLETKDVPQGGFATIIPWAMEIFEKQGGVARHKFLGDVVLNENSVKDSLAHGGANIFKRIAFKAVKDVIEKGRIIRVSSKNKNDVAYHISAPVMIDGIDDIVTVLVMRDANTQRMKIHSVTTKESLQQERVSKAQGEQNGSSSVEDNRSILQAALAVKPESVSKVVDGNGAPLVEVVDAYLANRSYGTNTTNGGGESIRYALGGVSPEAAQRAAVSVRVGGKDVVKSLGQLTDRYREKLQGLANALQGATAIDNNKWLEALARLTQFGADESSIERYAEATKNLAGILGGDINQAAELLSKALQGNFDAFGRVGIVVDIGGRLSSAIGHLASTVGVEPRKESLTSRHNKKLRGKTSCSPD